MGGVDIILTSESICKDEVRWTPTSPSPAVPGRLELEHESVPVRFFFVFFLHCFVINQETLGRKITISVYPPFTLTRWTGLLDCGVYNVKSC